MVNSANALPFNRPIHPDMLPGKHYLSIMSENAYNWYIIKTTINKADMQEFKPGLWGGGYETENQYIIIDKKSKKAIRAEMIDDIFHMIPKEYLSMGLLEWQDNRVYFALPPFMLKDLIETVNLENITSKTAKEVIGKLKNIPTDDNPVIFSFSLKDRFEIRDR